MSSITPVRLHYCVPRETDVTVVLTLRPLRKPLCSRRIGLSFISSCGLGGIWTNAPMMRLAFSNGSLASFISQDIP
jgi:hypothetical protein